MTPVANPFLMAVIDAMCDAISETLDVVVGFTLAGEDIWIAEVSPLGLIEIHWNATEQAWEVKLNQASGGPRPSLWFYPFEDPQDEAGMIRYAAQCIRCYCEDRGHVLPEPERPYHPPRGLYLKPCAVQN
jgi:hypothetical protein